MVAWVHALLGALLAWLLFTILLILVLVAACHRPLPPYIADRKKIQIVEFLMRISNEYLGNLVERLFGPVVRNRLTRFLSALPFWLLQRRPPKWCQIRNERIAGVKCRIYLAQGAAKKTEAGLAYIHGGGWCMGRPRFYDGTLVYLMRRLGLAGIVSIDYSLSPEVKFPTALLECERVLAELNRQKFAELGIDKRRVALMGDSAGGNLCAVLCQRAREHKTVKCHVLVYPVIHLFDFQSPSYQFFYQCYPGTGLLNPKMLIRWLLFYLGVEPTAENIRLVAHNRHLSRGILEDKNLMALIEAKKLPEGLPGQKTEAMNGREKGGARGKNGEKNGANGGWRSNKIDAAEKGNYRQQNPAEKELSDRLEPLLRNPDLCPLMAKDLAGLCPAMICTAGIDILRDEGIHYARRLREFGIPVEWKHYEAAYHGILNMGKSRQRAQILDDICDYLGRNLLASDIS